MNKSIYGNPAVMYIFSAAVLIALWQAMALAAGSPIILPSPAQTAAALFRNGSSSAFWRHVGASALRSTAAFVLSAALGSLLGVCAGLNARIQSFLYLPLAFIRSAPVVSFILMAVFWFGSDLVPVFVAVLMCLPIMVQSVCAGIHSTDRRLLEMARVYGFTKSQTLRSVYVPSAFPYAASGLLSSFGLSWKVVAAGEVLCLPRSGTGTLLQEAKVHLNTDEVFAVTLVIVLCSFAAERLFALLIRFVSGGLRRPSAGRDIREKPV